VSIWHSGVVVGQSTYCSYYLPVCLN